MPNKQFLETFPLFKEYFHTHPFDGDIRNLRHPAVHMDCLQCKSDQTFNFEAQFNSDTSGVGIHYIDGIVTVIYLCTSCRAFRRLFSIRFERDGRTLSKVGQFPAPSIEISPDFKDSLGEHAETFKRGLICENQGYGIGAFAYYRRIVEQIIDALLDDVYALLEPDAKEKYKETLQKAKASKVAEEKIKIAKEILPDSLRPGGVNPLDTIYDALSDGIHDGTDAHCLDLADAVRQSIVFLVEQVTRSRKSGMKYGEAMKKLLDKRAARGRESSKQGPV